MTRQFNVDKKLVWEEGKALEFKNEPKNIENEFIDVFRQILTTVPKMLTKW